VKGHDQKKFFLVWHFQIRPGATDVVRCYNALFLQDSDGNYLSENVARCYGVLRADWSRGLWCIAL